MVRPSAPSPSSRTVPEALAGVLFHVEHGVEEYGLALHVEVGIVRLLERVQSGRVAIGGNEVGEAAVAANPDVVYGTGRCRGAGFDDDCTGSVAESRDGGAVVGVEQAGECLRRDDKDALRGASQHRVPCDAQGEKKSAADGSDVVGRDASVAESMGNLRRDGWAGAIRCGGRENELVYLGTVAQDVECLVACCDSEVRSGLGRSDVSLPNPGARTNPLIGGVEALCEHVVGLDLGGHSRPGSGDDGGAGHDATPTRTRVSVVVRTVAIPGAPSPRPCRQHHDLIHLGDNLSLDAVTHPIGQLPVTSHRGMLVAEHDPHIGRAASAHQLSQRRTLLRKEGQAGVPKVMEPESQRHALGRIPGVPPEMSPLGV